MRTGFSWTAFISGVECKNMKHIRKEIMYCGSIRETAMSAARLGHALMTPEHGDKCFRPLFRTKPVKSGSVELISLRKGFTCSSTTKILYSAQFTTKSNMTATYLTYVCNIFPRQFSMNKHRQGKTVHNNIAGHQYWKRETTVPKRSLRPSTCAAKVYQDLQPMNQSWRVRQPPWIDLQ